MFKADYKKLRLSFNEFHDASDKDLPQHGEYCLLGSSYAEPPTL